MTITAQVPIVVVEGNGATTAFNYNFEVPYQDDGITPAVLVYVWDGVSSPIPVDPTLYVIAGVDVENGGTVTYPLSGPPVAFGEYVIIKRDLAYSQGSVFLNTAFLPSSIEHVADRLEMQLQQLALLGAGGDISPVISGVASFNGRSGGVTLLSSDIQSALGYVPVNRNGDTMTGKLSLLASAVGTAGVNLGAGAAPTSPANGDLWATSAGFFGRAGGVDFGPFGAGGGGGAVTSVNGMTGAVSVTLAGLGAEVAAVAYGWLADGATNNLAILNAIIADINAGTVRSVKFPPGVSIVSGNTTQLTKGCAFVGCGSKLTQIWDTGGTSILLDWNDLAADDMIILKDIQFRTTQVEGRQFCRMDFIAPGGYTPHIFIQEVEVRSDSSAGWSKGIQIRNAVMGRFNNVSVNGRISAVTPAGHSHMEYAWMLEADDDTSHYTVDMVWVGCASAGVATVYKGRNQLQGLYWYGCPSTFVGTVIDLDITTAPIPAPSFIVVGCWMEFYNNGIVMNGVAHTTIQGNQVLRNTTTPAAALGYSIIISNATNVIVDSNFCLNGDPGGIVTHGVVLSTVTNGKTSNNWVGGSAGVGIYFANDSANCHSANDSVDNIQAGGVMCENLGANILTNSFRGMTSNSIAQSVRAGGSGASIGFGGTSFVNMVSLPPMRTVIGEEYLVTYMMGASSISTNMTPGFRMREFNHRPAAPFPFDVFKVASTETQILDSKATFAATSVRFTASVKIRIVGTADDSLFQFDLNSDTGTATCVENGVEVTRL